LTSQAEVPADLGLPVGILDGQFPESFSFIRNESREAKRMSTPFVLRELSRYPIGTFADIIYRNSILFQDSEAFVCGSQRVSFREFNLSVNRLVHGLKTLNIHKGEVVGVLSWNRLEYCQVFGSAMKAGFVLAHFSPRLQAQELVHVINDSRAQILFLSHEFAGIVETIRKQLTSTKIFSVFDDAAEGMVAFGDLAQNQSTQELEPIVGEKDPLVIFYTSGTTGTPRGAIYTHEQKMENTCMKALEIGVKFGDRHLDAILLFLSLPSILRPYCSP
jgi:long-chain acyl-CoA synthetase